MVVNTGSVWRCVGSLSNDISYYLLEYHLFLLMDLRSVLDNFLIVS